MILFGLTEQLIDAGFCRIRFQQRMVNHLCKVHKSLLLILGIFNNKILALLGQFVKKPFA